MRLTGVEFEGSVWVAVLHGSDVRLVAQVDVFYRDVDRYLAEARADLAGLASLTSVAYRPPVPATAKVLCAGLNYRAHAAEANQALPAHPDIFGRWASTLVSSGTAVPIPKGEDGLDWEGELAVVVGSVLHHASPEEVQASIVGYTCFNDLSARTHQLNAGQWTIGKNADKSGPIGPALVTPDEIGDPYQLRIRTLVDGVVMQDAMTSQMLFTIGQIGAYASDCMTLHPGDVIATGTPEGIGLTRTPPVLLQPGQVVEVEIDRIGTLTTPIVAGASASEFRQPEGSVVDNHVGVLS